MELLGQYGRPWLGEEGSFDFVCVEEELVEEELVGQPPDLWSAEAVDLVASADQAQRYLERFLDVGVDGLGDFEDAVGVAAFLVDPVMFVAGEVAGDAAIDDTTGEPFTFLFELVDPAACPGDLGFGLSTLVVEFEAEAFADDVLHVEREADGAVVVGDGFLDGIDAHDAGFAVGAAFVTAEAVEVVVDTTAALARVKLSREPQSAQKMLPLR